MEPDLRRFTTRQVNFVREDGLSEIVLEVKDFSKYLIIGRTWSWGKVRMSLKQLEYLNPFFLISIQHGKHGNAFLFTNLPNF